MYICFSKSRLGLILLGFFSFLVFSDGGEGSIVVPFTLERTERKKTRDREVSMSPSCHYKSSSIHLSSLPQTSLKKEEDHAEQSDGTRHSQFEPRRSGLSPCISSGNIRNNGDGGKVATPPPTRRHYDFDSDAADASAGVRNHRPVGDGKREWIGRGSDGFRGADDDYGNSD